MDFSPLKYKIKGALYSAHELDLILQHYKTFKDPRFQVDFTDPENKIVLDWELNLEGQPRSATNAFNNLFKYHHRPDEPWSQIDRNMISSLLGRATGRWVLEVFPTPSSIKRELSKEILEEVKILLIEKFKNRPGAILPKELETPKTETPVEEASNIL